MTTLDIARSYVAVGLSVIPIKADGSKSPALKAWKEFQGQLPRDAELAKWFAGTGHGVAVVCGAVSGGLECLDFDEVGLFDEWLEAVVDAGARGLSERLCVIVTPSGGRHVWYRVEEGCRVPGNTALAWAPTPEGSATPRQVRIETRGEGGYALAPGCPRGCHEQEEFYTHHPDWISLPRVARISAELREDLLAVARSFDLTAVPEVSYRGVETPDKLRPGDDFDLRGNWDFLQSAGWAKVRESGGVAHWRRPGKAHGWSATTGHCRGSRGEPLLHVFSASAHPFEAGKAYGLFRALALVNHGGDLAKTASFLAKLGYGSPVSPTKKGAGAKPPATEPARPREEPEPREPPIPFDEYPTPEFPAHCAAGLAGGVGAGDRGQHPDAPRSRRHAVSLRCRRGRGPQVPRAGLARLDRAH